jgi:hypothetical protein
MKLVRWDDIDAEPGGDEGLVAQSSERGYLRLNSMLGCDSLGQVRERCEDELAWLLLCNRGDVEAAPQQSWCVAAASKRERCLALARRRGPTPQCDRP